MTSVVNQRPPIAIDPVLADMEIRGRRTRAATDLEGGKGSAQVQVRRSGGMWSRVKRLATLLLGVALIAFLGLFYRLQTMDRSDYLYEMLKCHVDVWERHNITYVLDAGTLLGAVREQDIIQGDEDVDILVLKTEQARVLQTVPEIMERCGTMTITRYDNYVRKPLFNHVYRADRSLYRSLYSWHTPIFIDVKEMEFFPEDKLWYSREFIGDDDSRFPDDVMFPLRRSCKIRDLLLPCPNKKVEAVVIEYGKNWKQPSRFHLGTGESPH